MTMQTFADVVLRRNGTTQEDIGNLTITGDSIRFDGRKEQLRIADIQFVSISRPSGLALGAWVKVEYVEALQPSVVYLKEKRGAGGVNRIYPALQHFPNSQQFECRVWVQMKRRFALALGSAPRKHWGFTAPRNGVLAATGAQTLTLSARRLKVREVALSDVAGYTRELLTAKRQLLSVGFDSLLVGAGLGGLVSVVYLLNGISAGKASLMGFLNLFALCLGLGIGLCLLFALPTLLRLRTLELFTLKFKNGRQWDFGVPEGQTENVIQILKAYGFERLSM